MRFAFQPPASAAVACTCAILLPDTTLLYVLFCDTVLRSLDGPRSTMLRRSARLLHHVRSTAASCRLPPEPMYRWSAVVVRRAGRGQSALYSARHSSSGLCTIKDRAHIHHHIRAGVVVFVGDAGKELYAALAERTPATCLQVCKWRF